MKKFKHILFFLILVTATLVINGGKKAKSTVIPSEATGLIKAAVVHGFPDMVSFSNFINQ